MAATAIVPVSVLWVKRSVFSGERPTSCYETRLMPTQSEQPDDLRGSVIDRFGKVADTPSQERKFPVGPEIAKKLGYEHAEVDALPSAVTESFCGVGNPFSLDDPQLGQTVLDLGCGAGLDTLLAARKVTPNGKGSLLDGLSHIILDAGSNGLGEEGVDEPSGREQWFWLDAGYRRLGHGRDRADLGARPKSAEVGAAPR